MKIRARMRCESVLHQAWAPDYKMETVKLTAVATDDESDPNYTYSQATPSGFVELVITAKEAHGAFVPGELYDITFEPTPRVD